MAFRGREVATRAGNDYPDAGPQRTHRDRDNRDLNAQKPPPVGRSKRGLDAERLLTVLEASECVGCCEETIRRAYLARQLDVLRFGRRNVRIRRSELFAWLERGGKTSAA
jgi:excisionase family DNA binding protein